MVHGETDRFASVQATDSSTPTRLDLVLYGFTFLTSAFLLFQVQLIICKYILPWFGGTPSVFTTCMLAFQVLLLLGYGYAFVVSSRLQPLAQMLLHFSVLGITCSVLIWRVFAWQSPILPPSTWKPEPSGSPVLQILVVLLASVALPYLVLSTTASLLQTWFGRTYNRLPYRWYSLSNTGSLLGLLTYPFIVEPKLSLRHQAVTWFIAFTAFAMSCAWIATRFAKRPEQSSRVSSERIQATTDSRPGWHQRLVWLLLAACGSSMLLATTNQICQDVAVIPLLWVLPLSLYLLSFILCFDSEKWYSRQIWSLALGFGVLLIVFALYHPTLSLKLQIPFYCFGLFAACMVCHGELIQLKPAAADVAGFYLMVAAGGALGGAFVSLIAPLVFKGYWEFQVSVWTSCFLLLAILLRDTSSWVYHPRPWLLAFSAQLVFTAVGTTQPGQSPMTLLVLSLLTMGFIAFILTGNKGAVEASSSKTAARFSVAFTAIALAGMLGYPAVGMMRGALATSRNFYGTLRVLNSNPGFQPNSRKLLHGKIIHGLQYFTATDRDVPTCYYAPQSGIGLVIAQQREHLGEGRSLRVGVVGLGAGTIAGYGRINDYVRFYEINPEVIRMSASPNGYFTYVNDSPANIDVIPGDARISMERELAAGSAQQFDVLAIDAFSGDAVPMHLLTAEAFKVYEHQLRGHDSLMAFHVTNGNLDLAPAIARAAEEIGKTASVVETNAPDNCSNSWVVVADGPNLPTSSRFTPLRPDTKFRLWTDDYSNVLSVLRR